MKTSSFDGQLFWRKKALGYKEAYSGFDEEIIAGKSANLSRDTGLTKFSPDNIPIMYWPSGRYCLEASLFLYHLYSNGLSTLGGGGSLITYASYLSHLLRYCHISNIDFCSMTDGRFTMFMRGLRTETTLMTGEIGRRRRRQTIIKMGRLYLKFFDFIGEVHRIPSMVESVLGAHRRRTNTLTAHGWISTQYWHHRSFPTSEELRRRRPMADASVAKLFEANAQLKTTNYKRRRRYVMLLLLKATGGRRLEIAMLRISAIKNALKQPGDLVMLTLPNVKQNGMGLRKVPISRGDLLQVEKYIEFDRRKVINSRRGKNIDGGWLLLNERTGAPLNASTITAEFALLARAAGLTGQACAHMLRHRYLVKLFIELILESGTRDAEQFRGLLFSNDTLAFKLRERSGHMSVGGVEWYTKLGLEQLLHLEKALGRAYAAEIVRSFPATIEELEFEISSRKLDEKAALQLYRSWAEQTKKDIAGALKADSEAE
ncbi:tyrosine-type recombinase/integrase [Burkholderia contaminans]|uniref:tyrosine-type recombinase/integrase n=1 Tax=Burkholderia contaminans TaxID=488447 RepID=UPI001CF411B6|nr:tyrosine-type recombinase/integrase [Burkholderia contaminans]MCA7889725.1 tyrosine-type recombinase/integrase [Burkholderia contaminans]